MKSPGFGFLKAVAIFLLVTIAGTATRVHGQDAIFGVRDQSGPELQSLAPSYWLEVTLWGNAVIKDQNFSDILSDNVKRGWNCSDVMNYLVTYDNSAPLRGNPRAASAKAGKTLKIRRVAFRWKSNPGEPAWQGCRTLIRQPGSTAPFDLTVLLYVDENQPLWRSISGNVKVAVKGLLVNGSSITVESSKPTPVQWKASILTASAQTVNNETLIDKTIFKKAIYQFPISSSLPLVANNRGGLFVETKDLFSTNERDSKSAFMAGAGYQAGLLNRWTMPLKLEQQMTGNQVATNLSAVTTAQVSTTLPWFDALTPGAAHPESVANDLPAFDQSPNLTVGFPYTRRIRQVLASGSKPLPVNDFAIIPAIALGNERLIEFGAYKARQSNKVPPFSTQWEADWGMYYLPLETTASGSKRAEGSGDVSVLIPISDFQVFPGLTLDQKTQVNQMQLRIKWQDTVNPTNNYVRTRGWTFGLEVVVKK
jgi:hypothetical protein